MYRSIFIPVVLLSGSLSVTPGRNQSLVLKDEWGEIFSSHCLLNTYCNPDTVRHRASRGKLIGKGACLLKFESKLNKSCLQMLCNFHGSRAFNLLTCFKLKLCLDLSLFLRIFASLSFIVLSFLQKDVDKLAYMRHSHFEEHTRT